ncbi:MAG TPA: hypothetical protein VM661_12595 [Candidatus Sulfotelmatobacter sp.]|jgi:hypothetical protein|nr:hypothetical protein [Candidatus Sulfotelmatobacter sp.]
MFKFIGKALAGVLLTGDARKAVAVQAKTPPKTAAGKKKAKAKPQNDDANPAEREAVAQVQAQAKELITEDRAELIRKAMQVRAAKQTILADLNDEDRARLVATAMKALLNEGRQKKE